MSESSTKKYFFTKDSKYRIVDDKVNIETSKKENVSIPVETFIHYDDGSLSTFSKSAILDLNDLSQKTYNYYNIYPGTVFTKNGTNYTVTYLDKRLNFNNFLLKISDTKYMIIGNKMELQIGDIKKTINNNYLEVSSIFCIVSGSFTYLGLILGNKLGSIFGKLSTIIGGVILIILGIIYFFR